VESQAMAEKKYKLYSIGEVSQIKNIPVKTLRYYHQEKLLVPKHINEQSGYRYYTADQFLDIDIIKACRELGTSIQELKKLFQLRDLDKLLAFAQTKKNEAEAKISSLKTIVKNIDNLMIDMNNSRTISSHKEIQIEHFESRYAVFVDYKNSGELEELVRYSELDVFLEKHNISKSYRRGISYNFKEKNKLIPVNAFCIIEKAEINEIKNKTFFIPEGKFITLVYDSDNKEIQRNKIFSYLTANNLQPEMYLEIELLKNIFEWNPYFRQIQVLI
jgi:DNA-binding transcriptional MerR regulator